MVGEISLDTVSVVYIVLSILSLSKADLTVIFTLHLGLQAWGEVGGGLGKEYGSQVYGAMI